MRRSADLRGPALLLLAALVTTRPGAAQVSGTYHTLLFEWLGRLVYLKDAEGEVFHQAALQLTQEADGSAWHLHADLSGAPVDPATQELRSDVKGVTKHLYAVTHEGNQWTTRVVLDVCSSGSYAFVLAEQ